MAEAFFLTEALRNALYEILAQWQQDNQNNSGRPPHSEGEGTQAPEHYIALSGEDGIPPLVPGTDEDSDGYDRPGIADCNIYRIVEVEGDVALEQVIGLSKTVFNLSTCTLPANEWVHVLRDKAGSWWALDVCRTAASTTRTTGTTGTTTTTTPTPCHGTCRWTCTTGSGGAGTAWLLTEVTCEDERPGTGTAPDDDEEDTGTGTSSPCHCVEPTYCCGTCGTAGEVTSTPCTKGRGRAQPDCSGTTTTTTPPPSGCFGCRWLCRDGNWYKVFDDCVTDDCLECPYPDEACTSTCIEAFTDCRTPPPPDPSSCAGDCRWFWDTYWTLTNDNPCSSSVDIGAACQCLYPSIDGDECGDILVTQCVIFPDPGTTPPPQTTTTPIGCTGSCRWRWSTSLTQWTLLCTDCPPSCLCAITPAYPGAVDSETALVPCQATTTTTTTTTTSTTTTTTTTNCGNCVWHCLTDIGYWTLSSNDCVSPCECPEPPTACVSDGAVSILACAPTTTTSTTSTTTSTLTTCTTTPRPAPTCGTCTYRSYGGFNPSWILYSSTCPEGCTCVAPACAPTGSGGGGSFEQAVTNCTGTPVTTTTTTTTTSTTSTTTTTTTTPAPGGPCPDGGSCFWLWDGATWNPTSNTCGPGCGCTPPTSPGTTPGDVTMNGCITV